MAGGHRASAEQFAERINAAVALIAAGVGVAEAARILAARFATTTRQGYRYVHRAAVAGPLPLVEPTTAVTVKIPVDLADGLRDHARRGDGTISALVTAAVRQWMADNHQHDRVQAGP